jgi:hypothetical protein
MAAKTKAAKTGAAAYALRKSPYVQRLLQDPELREQLAQALRSSRDAYARLNNGKAPQKAIFEDKRLKKDIKRASESFRYVGEGLREGPKRKRGLGLGKLILLAVLGVAVALGVSEGLRKKALDALFGAEEEFEYTSPTTTSSSADVTTTTVNGGEASGGSASGA